MKSALAKEALLACFQQFGIEALYMPTKGEATSIRLLVKQPDAQVSFHETRILNTTHIFEILAEICPQPLRGDRIQLGEESFTIQHVEARDPLRLVWTVEVAKP